MDAYLGTYLLSQDLPDGKEIMAELDVNAVDKAQAIALSAINKGIFATDIPINIFKINHKEESMEQVATVLKITPQ